jgi:hypothetical protein
VAISTGVREDALRTQVLAIGRRWVGSQRELIGLLAEFDRSGEWALDGYRTCAHWLADEFELEPCTTREWVRIAHAIDSLPMIRSAFLAGRLSYSKLRAVTRVATPQADAELCALAVRTPAAGLAHVLAAWLAGRETPEETETRHRRSMSLRWRTDPDGMVAGSFRLPPLEAAQLTAAIDAWVVRQTLAPTATPTATDGGEDAISDAPMPRRATGSWPSLARQRAAGLLAAVCGGGSTVETEVLLHVRADGCTLDDGTPIAGSIIERLVPAAFLRVLIHDADSRPINASGRQRHPTSRQQRVVKERDRHCVDCGRADLLRYDHDPAFATSRHTRVDELELRCAPCHHTRHGP